jgi:hypothetical protein
VDNPRGVESIDAWRMPIAAAQPGQHFAVHSPLPSTGRHALRTAMATVRETRRSEETFVTLGLTSSEDVSDTSGATSSMGFDTE